MSLYTFGQKISNICNRIFKEPIIKKSFARAGRNVRIAKKCYFSGVKNIYVGNDVSFGLENIILSTKANCIIGDSVMFGPRVTIVTGDHRIDLIGRTMKSITDKEKLLDNYRALLEAIIKAKPAAAKGVYIKSIALASTMGPGVKINNKLA